MLLVIANVNVEFNLRVLFIHTRAPQCLVHYNRVPTRDIVSPCGHPCIYTSWTCGKMLSRPQSSCQDLFACFVACLPNASMNTMNPKRAIMRRLIFILTTIGAFGTFYSVSSSWL